MEPLLIFVCTICALVFMVQITTSVKLSLRQGPQTPETANPDMFAMSGLKNCTMCPRLFKPICASNGNWYHNPCFMACDVGDNSSVNILYEGICRPEHSSTKHIINITTEHIINITTEHIINKSTKHFTNTPATDKIMMGCTVCDKTYYQPLCGTDGKTYVNECLMNCTVNRNIVKVAYTGKCVVYYAPPAFSSNDHYIASCKRCPRIYDPVCMTNGEWYYNACVMYCALGNDTDLKIRYQGKCITFWRKSEDTTTRS